ncbi:MAG: acyloxyacyl hydrolase [Alphaproteobacteria bacterium]|nr:acyloxyacyl hydrolase [Alphaproteobacteria bacterium]
MDVRSMYRSILVFLAATVVYGCAALQASGPAVAQEVDDPDFLSLGLGYFDINDDDGAAEFRLEYRSDKKIFFLKPFTGLMVTTDSAFHGYAGVLLDLYLGRRAVMTPSFAAGYFHNGNGKDLGSDIEFRSQIELAYRFDDRSRLGLAFSHISNASIADRNPGTEILTITYAVPFSKLQR